MTSPIPKGGFHSDGPIYYAGTPSGSDELVNKGYVDGISGGVSDHGALTGLSDDDHTQYALLAGRGGASSVSNTEFGYLNGATSNLQTQITAIRAKSLVFVSMRG